MVRYVCSWQHQSTSKKMMGIEEPPYGVCFKCGKPSHWQETAFASTADSVLSKLDKQDRKEANCRTLPRQGRPVFKIPASQ